MGELNVNSALRGTSPFNLFRKGNSKKAPGKPLNSTGQIGEMGELNVNSALRGTSPINLFRKGNSKKAPSKPVNLGNVKVNIPAPIPSKSSAKTTKANVTNDKINATILWKDSYLDLTIYENKDCNQITQYLQSNPNTAVIYKMIQAEIEKAKKKNAKGDWIAVLCYMKNGEQVNKPITRETFRVDLYNNVIRRDNKEIKDITSLPPTAGGKRRSRAVTKKNIRRSKRNHTYRK